MIERRVQAAVAAALQAVVDTVQEADIKADPMAVFLRLAEEMITVLEEDGIKVSQVHSEDEAAGKIFQILGVWLASDQKRSYFVRTSDAGKLEITLNTTEHQHTERFYGETLQDAHAQAAQTVALQ